MNGEELTDEQVQILYAQADQPPKWMTERMERIGEVKE